MHAYNYIVQLSESAVNCSVISNVGKEFAHTLSVMNSSDRLRKHAANIYYWDLGAGL